MKTKRFKIRRFFAPPDKGWSESAEWDFDEEYIRRIAAVAANRPKNERVEIAIMEKRNGRWGNFRTEIVPKTTTP